MPTVANRHWYRYVFGWGPAPLTVAFASDSRPAMPDDAIYVGRGSPLGNPYTSRDWREKAIPKFRRHLWNLIQRRDPSTMLQLRSIGPDTLVVCSCAPAPCHVEVIIAAWQWLCDQGEIYAPAPER